jgi:hypothetical protein
MGLCSEANGMIVSDIFVPADYMSDNFAVFILSNIACNLMRLEQAAVEM